MKGIKIPLKLGFVVFTLITFILTASFISWATGSAWTNDLRNGNIRVDGIIQTATPRKNRSKKKRKAKQETMTTKPVAVPPSIWGADHIIFNVAANGVTIEYDCADGQIEQSLMIDESGNFTANGVHIARQAGPVSIDDKQTRQPALYAGKISGDTMTLNITLTETKQVIGEFTLERGKIPETQRCY